MREPLPTARGFGGALGLGAKSYSTDNSSGGGGASILRTSGGTYDLAESVSWSLKNFSFEVTPRMAKNFLVDFSL